jgi:hypothetical protein
MKTVTLEEVHQQFDDLAVSKTAVPLEIINEGESLGVFLPHADAELIEDILLGYKATAARQEGFIGEKSSRNLLERFRHAQD